MVARFYQVLAADIWSLHISAIISLETRLNVPIVAIFLTIFSIFQAVRFCISLWPRAMTFDLGLYQRSFLLAIKSWHRCEENWETNIFLSACFLFAMKCRYQFIGNRNITATIYGIFSSCDKIKSLLCRRLWCHR